MIPFEPETGAVEGALGAQAAPVCSPVAMATHSLITDELLLSYQKALTFTLCLFYYSFCTIWLSFPPGPGCSGEMFLLGEWEMAFLSISVVFTPVGEAQQTAG